MKKKTLIILMSTLFFLPLQSQKFFIAPRAGFNLASITPVKDGHARSGINFGVSVDYMFSTRFGLETGAFYSMQGLNFEQTGKKTNHEYMINTDHDYIVLPLLAKYFLKNYYIEAKGLNVFGGVQLDVKALVDKVGYTTGNEGQLMPNDMTKPLGISLVTGIGYLFSSGLMFSTNINWGLSNIANDNFKVYNKQLAGTTTGDMKRDRAYRNLVFQLNFGYRFSLGKRYGSYGKGDGLY